MIELTTRRRASPRRIGITRKSSEEIIGSVTNEFLTTLPPAEESSICSKNKVISDLQLKKDILIAQERSFAADNFFSESEIDDVCIILDSQLTDIILEYVTPIIEAAKNIAKIKIKEIIPLDPGDIGVALPTLSRKILEKAIEKKKEEIALLMVKDIEEYHFSWYTEDDAIGFDEVIDAWANTVRARSKELKRTWTFRSLLFLLLMLPLVVSMLYNHSDKCKPGFYNTVSVTDDSGVLTVSTLTQCLPCERGSFAPGGKKSSRALCKIGTYSSDFAEECSSCPEHSFNTKEGSSTCECFEGYKTIFKKSEHHMRHLECEKTKIVITDIKDDTVKKDIANIETEKTEIEKTETGKSEIGKIASVVITEEINEIENNLEIQKEELVEVVIDDKGEVETNTKIETKTVTEPEVQITETKAVETEITETETTLTEITVPEIEQTESILIITEMETVKMVKEMKEISIENTEIVETESERTADLTESVTAITETENTEIVELEIVESKLEIMEVRVIEKKTEETEVAIEETEITETENIILEETESERKEETGEIEIPDSEKITNSEIIIDPEITESTITEFTSENSSFESELDSVANDVINYNMKIIREIEEESRVRTESE